MWVSASASAQAYVYWTNPVDNAIGRANLHGTGAKQSFIPGATAPHGVAVDGAHAYWTNANGSTAAPTSTARALTERPRRRDQARRADGTGAEFVIPSGEFESCGGLALGETHMYWAQFGSIGRARLDGTKGTGELIDARAGCAGVAVDARGPTPSNEFNLGKVQRDVRRGSAKLTVHVAGPGELDLARSAKVKRASVWADDAGKTKLTVKLRGSAKERVKERGKTKVTPRSPSRRMAVRRRPRQGRSSWPGSRARSCVLSAVLRTEMEPTGLEPATSCCETLR